MAIRKYSVPFLFYKLHILVWNRVTVEPDGTFPLNIPRYITRNPRPRDQYSHITRVAFFLYGGWGGGGRGRDRAVVRALASHQCGPGMSLLLVLVFAPRVYLRILRFSSLHWNQDLQILIWPGTHGHVWIKFLSGELFAATWVNKLRLRLWLIFWEKFANGPF